MPAFEFRGLRPGVTTYAQSRRSLALHDCTAVAGGGSCDLRDPSLGDVTARQAFAVFEHGVLRAIRITFPSAAYVRMRRSVILAYGPPCEAAGETLPAHFGGGRSNATASWCFSGGKLVLVRYQEGEDGRDTGSLDFLPTEGEMPAKGAGKNRL